MSKKRIVVKIGSSSLTNNQGEIDQEKFIEHVDAIAKLRQYGHEVVLVSSGAVATGFKKLGYRSRPVTLKGKQAAAAVGQSLLIRSYIEKFGEHGIVPAQILLTRTDFSHKERYHNAHQTLSELIDRGLIPIINENDTVSVEELTFGDNDMLSALVSGMIHADRLIILTDINGLYTGNPKNDKDAKKLDAVETITDELLAGAGDTGSSIGTGGMRSKLLAAKTALDLGVQVFIGKGEGTKKLLDILSGAGDGTYVGNDALTSVNNKRQWIWVHSDVAGKLYVDQGAERALLETGSSLLPAGIYEIQGDFKKGDTVEVHGENGLIGRGAVHYSLEDLREAMGKHSSEVLTGPIEVIHRDNWVRISE